MEELKDSNQQFADRHQHALELFGQGDFREALEEWRLLLALCAGRPIQEQSVLSGIVEASIRVGEYGRARELLERMIAQKRERGLEVPSGLTERVRYLEALSANEASSAPKPKKQRKRS